MCRYHFGLTYQAATTTLSLYLDGKLALSSSSVTMHPSSVGNITQPLLGFSQGLNLPTDARFMDFRFYTGALK